MVKYYSLAAASLVGLVNPSDEIASGWKGDLRNYNFDYGNADGSEIILPVAVWNPLDQPATDLFNLIDNYIRGLGSLQDADFTYGAHHVGRAFPGYNYTPLSTADQKGWNIIVSGGRLIITFEGDFDACIKLAREVNIDDVEGDSNKLCSFNAANEYCHRHGGQLYIPDEFYWNFMFNPMCNTDEEQNRKHANPFGAKYSQAEFWLNLQAVNTPVNGDDIWDIRTTSNFHMFHELNLINKWAGVTQAGQISQSINQSKRNTYEDLLTQSVDSTGDFKNTAFHDLLGDISFDKEDMGAHVDQLNLYLNTKRNVNGLNDQRPFLNMHYISEQLQGGGLESQTCLIIDCQGGLERPKIQDSACDHNNVRPLCLINNLFEHFSACPQELKQNLNGNDELEGAAISHCGDNVRPVIVQNVFNYKGFYEIADDRTQQERFFHAWNTGTGGAASKHNPIHVLRNLYRSAVIDIAQQNIPAGILLPEDMGDYFFSGDFESVEGTILGQLDDNNQLPQTPIVELYTNCYGSFNADDDKWYLDILKSTDSDPRSRKTICSEFGYRYDQGVDFDTNSDGVVDFVRYTVNEATTNSTTLTKDCRCTCDAKRTFLDQNALVSTTSNGDYDRDFGDVVVKESSETFCCADGFEFVPSVDANGVNVYNYEIDTCNRCVTLYCRDEVDFYNDGNHKDFWNQLESAGNKRRVWWTSQTIDDRIARNKHLNANIQGSCVPLTCRPGAYNAPTPNALCETTATVSQIVADGSYPQGHTAAYACGAADCCGQHIDTCVRDNTWTRPAPVNETVVTCNPYVWQVADTCDPKYCTTKTTPFSRILDDKVQIQDGESYTIECDRGYIAFRDGVTTNGRTASTTCQIESDASGICGVATEHDITCRPVVCSTNPPSECAFDEDLGPWPVLSTVNCDCGPGTCGQRTSQCTLNANGLTASWNWIANGNQCEQKRCEVTSLANAVLVNNAAFVFNGGSFSHRCNAGFAMYELNDDGEWEITADGKTAKTDCRFPGVNDVCLSGSLPCCRHTPPVLYECRPITCGTDPCLSDGYGFQASALVSGWSLGDTVVCQCPPNERALIGDAVQDGCGFICRETANGSHRWEYVNEECQCKPPMCAKPCEIPNGVMKYKTNLNDLAWSNWAVDRTESAVGTWASYKCNTGFELVFSHNDQPANEQHCAMQCYNPVENSCIADEVNYNRLNPIAVMDPLNCYCKSKECVALDDVKNLGDDHVWVDAADKLDTYYPVPGFNTVDVKCKGDKFPLNKGIGGGNADQIVCRSYDDWSPPNPCVETACRDPRFMDENTGFKLAGSYWAPGLKIEHTCKSRDTVAVNGKLLNLPGQSFLNTTSAQFADNADLNIGYTNPRAQPVGEGMPANVVYLADSGDNIKNGAVYTFTCKKGWSPYFNAAAVVNGADRTAQPGTGFDCTCENGIWACNMECRCEGFCEV